MRLAILAVLTVLVVAPTIGTCQDYFSDLHSNGTPVLMGRGDDKAVFNIVANVGDNSLKVNFYRQYWIDSLNYHPLEVPRHKSFVGWGASAKGKTEDGLGSLFSSGQFDPSFTGGGYLSFTRRHWYMDNNLETYDYWAIILSGTFTTANFQLYNPSNAYASQLIDTSFNAFTSGLSFVKLSKIGIGNLFWGASVSYGRKNNYSSLDKVTIKDDSTFSTSTGTSRAVTKVNDNGDVYAIGEFTKYDNFNLRFNASIVPSVLHEALAATLYPSVDYSRQYSPKYNLGLAFSYLKKGSPSTTVATVYFELNDMGNAAGKSGAFLKRSFNVGVSTALNLFTSDK